MKSEWCCYISNLILRIKRGYHYLKLGLSKPSSAWQASFFSPCVPSVGNKESSPSLPSCNTDTHKQAWGGVKDMFFFNRLSIQLSRYLTDGEFESLYNACNDWLKPIVLAARHTGMRRENILSLKWNQVDLSRRIILLEHTKNNDRFGIPLNDTLTELFRGLSKLRHIRSPYVFSRSDGKRYVEIKRAFQKASDSGNRRFQIP